MTDGDLRRAHDEFGRRVRRAVLETLRDQYEAGLPAPLEAESNEVNKAALSAAVLGTVLALAQLIAGVSGDAELVDRALRAAVDAVLRHNAEALAEIAEAVNAGAPSVH